MYPHHAQSVANLVAALQPDPEILGLLLTGSIAHGYARPDSDIDVAILVDSESYQRRRRTGLLHYNNRELCTFDGYIDGKYVDLAFLQLVAERGSEPARYAFEGSRILSSRVDHLERLLSEIVRYPVHGKEQRLTRFAAQLLAWRWYFSEGVRQQSAYLKTLAVQKVVLFSTRLVLTANELLFPYHKWMLRVLESAPRRPPAMLEDIQLLLADPTWEQVDTYCRGVLSYLGIDFRQADATWPTWFMKDTELAWVDAAPAIDDC